MAVIPVNIKLKDRAKSITTYAFLDPGSSISFCTEGLMRELGAEGAKLRITLDTMAEPYSMDTYAVKNLEVTDLNNQCEISLPKIYTKDKIPINKEHIPTAEDVRRWDHLRDVTLPQIDGEIGLLLGNNIPDAYAPVDLKTGPRGSPHATKTLLGWAVWNLIRPSQLSSRDNAYPAHFVDITAIEQVEGQQKLDKALRESINRDFSEMASDEKKEVSQEDLKFKRIMDESMTLIDGHYQVCLPFRNNDAKLPNNEELATQRLKGLKRKMQMNPKFHADYTDFMNKMIKSGYSEKVPNEELERADGRVWYVPHHGVYHPQKPDKIRVVYDCSAKFNGVALNDLLLPGPDMTNNLMAVLLRFRQGNVAIMGDIEAMFHQVRLPKSDCDCLRFYWWPNGNIHSEPDTYRMKVHLFGAVSSPSCCNSALRKTATDNEDDFSPEVTKVVKDSFYVYDCLTSVETTDKATGLIEDVTALCQMGGFRLAKWASNSHEVLQSISPEDRCKETKSLDLQRDTIPSQRALGVLWDVEQDHLGFKIQTLEKPTTRRGILSVTSSLYDPLGVASPVTLQGKQIIQDLCKKGLDWDEPLSGLDAQRWHNWVRALPDLEKLSIPRCYRPANFGLMRRCELHLFADASDKGYGVVSYLRMINDNNNIHTSFLMAKSRVAPLKKVTVPRLELTAAAVAAKLSVQIKRQLEYKLDTTTYWTDSMSVLRYLQSETGRFQTFVANRVTLIREISEPSQWRYVSTADNPADAASRGQSISQFMSNRIWIGGPSFLQEPEAHWPSGECTPQDPVTATVVATEQKKDVLGAVFQHYSRWWKLKRTIGFILLAMDNLKAWVSLRKQVSDQLKDHQPDATKREELVDLQVRNLQRCHQKTALNAGKKVYLSLNLIHRAERAIIGHVQHQHFAKEISALNMEDNSTNKLNRTNPLAKLHPFMSEGLLRVGGRLDKSDLAFDAKHPILLPKESPVSKMILDETHLELGHLGKNYMLAKVQEKFWILGVRGLVKSLVSKCTTCRKYQSKAESQMMADLPMIRVTEEPPFSRTGMDFFGAFNVKRSRSVVKRYGVVFTCLTTRAVHLEVAHSMDMSSCINAIRRFVCRRGNVKLIKSDNGTNIVGSQRELKKEIQQWNQAHMKSTLQQKDIEWEFNPPSGSHFGGVWERVIRTARKILFSLMHEQMCRLDDEALQTLFCEVECILNSRPLTELPNSPDDLKALSPNDLLLLNSSAILPPGIFVPQDCYSRRRWRQVQFLANQFWIRWSKEYLPLLQQRQKWLHPSRNLSVGDLVLLMDQTPRSSWSLGRVVDVFPDSKGLVRTVQVRTSSSVLIRPSDKLCLVMKNDNSTD